MDLVGKVAYHLLRNLRLRAAQYSANKLRAKLGAIGDGCALNGAINVSSPGCMRIGSNVHIGDGAWIRAEGGLSIGDNTHISRNVVIYTINHDYRGEVLPYDERLVKKPVEIGPNVWIGMNVCIAPGTRIGEGVIVGMGATVSGYVPPCSIIGSSKWRMLGERDRDHYDARKDSGVFGGPSGRPYHVVGDRSA